MYLQSQLKQGSDTIEPVESADLTDSVESVSSIHHYGSYLFIVRFIDFVNRSFIQLNCMVQLPMEE